MPVVKIFIGLELATKSLICEWTLFIFLKSTLFEN